MREIRTSGSRRGGEPVPSYSTGSESVFYVYSHLLRWDEKAGFLQAGCVKLPMDTHSRCNQKGNRP